MSMPERRLQNIPENSSSKEAGTEERKKKKKRQKLDRRRKGGRGNEVEEDFRELKREKDERQPLRDVGCTLTLGKLYKRDRTVVMDLGEISQGEL